ncbi:MAG: HAD family hydrolase [Bacteroidaceae bacterium]|nr:HAD family hydrolase [Bacteroidaceae bacterium]
MNKELFKDIKALAFDFGGTIDSPFLHWMKVYLKIYTEQMQMPLTADNFRPSYIHAERELERLRLVQPTDGLLQTQRYKTRLHFEHLCQEGVLPVGTPIEALAERAAVLVTDYSNSFVQANKPVLEQLAQQFPLLLVSNYYGNLRTQIEQAGLLPLFLSITDSTVVGIRKPDPAIWQLAIQSAGFQPHEVLVIGDSFKNDIAPALSLGCRVVHCCSHLADAAPGVVAIQKLEELIS